MKLSDLMQRTVEVIAPNTTVCEAARRMSTCDVGALPVCQEDEVMGVLTDRDLVVRSVARGDDPTKTRVADVMTKEVEWCYEDDSVEEASEKMSEKQIQRLLVRDHDEKLVGILSLSDLARSNTEGVDQTLEEIKAPTKPSAAGVQHAGR